VQLGYAMTVDSSQRLTVDRAFVLAPDHGEQREWGYVALSRARRVTRIYVTEAALEIETQGPAPEHLDGLNRLARALAAPAARPLAHALDRDRSIGVEIQSLDLSADWAPQHGLLVAQSGPPGRALSQPNQTGSSPSARTPSRSMTCGNGSDPAPACRRRNSSA